MNLKSLARTLGISKTTVSRALNGYPEVSAHTRERVRAAAKASGYVANPMARSLAVGRSNVLGIIHPMLPGALGEPLFQSVVGGMSAALESSRMNLIIAPVSPQRELASYEHMVRGRRVDGLVVSHTLVDDARIAYLEKSGFPFVAHGRSAFKQGYAWLDHDDAAGIALATDHLLGLGHQRIALISAPLALHAASARRQAFAACMARAGLALDPRHLLDDAQDRRAGYRAMQQLLASSPRPTAAIVDNPLAAVGAVRALLDAGIGIGSAFSIIACGGIDDSLAGANIASIEHADPDRVGGKLIELLLARIDGVPASQLQVLWQPQLRSAGSAGPCQGSG